MSTDEVKVRSILEWPLPKTIRDVRNFLGLAGYYRKFVRNYAVIVGPLFQLTKMCKLSWKEDAEYAFKRLKTALSTTPVLALPDFSQPCG